MDRTLQFFRVVVLIMLSAAHALVISGDNVSDKSPAQNDLTEIAGEETPLAEGPTIIIDDEPVPLAESAPLFSEYITKLIELANTERNNVGLNSLEVTDLLQTAAAFRAAELEELYEHRRPDGRDWFTIRTDFNIPGRGIGENLNMKSTTPESTMVSWMNSAEHAANLLIPDWNKVGAGVHIGADGTMYWAMLYTD